MALRAVASFARPGQAELVPRIVGGPSWGMLQLARRAAPGQSCGPKGMKLNRQLFFNSNERIDHQLLPRAVTSEPRPCASGFGALLPHRRWGRSRRRWNQIRFAAHHAALGLLQIDLVSIQRLAQRLVEISAGTLILIESVLLGQLPRCVVALRDHYIENRCRPQFILAARTGQGLVV